MYVAIKTQEQAILAEKAKDDAESIRLMLYNLIKFSADIKLSGEAIIQLTSALKPVEEYQRGITYGLQSFKEKK